MIDASLLDPVYDERRARMEFEGDPGLIYENPI